LSEQLIHIEMEGGGGQGDTRYLHLLY